MQSAGGTRQNVPGRLEALDSLRGFAALSVVLMHFTTLAGIHSIAHTPLRLLMGGHEAVILFFVLSGYVLTLQITSGSFWYGGYVIRRFFRIYVPYVFALAFAAAIVGLLWQNGAANADPAVQRLAHATTHDFVRNAIVLLPFDTQQINPVVWTLSYELRISLVLPLVVAMSATLGVSATLAMTFLGSLLAAFVTVHSGQKLETASYDAEWLPTLHYLFLFACGHALASKRSSITAWLERHKLATWLMIVSALSYLPVQKIATIHHFAIHDFIWDWLIAVCVCGMIAGLTSPGIFRTVLQLPALTWLGRISYSLYLYHFVLFEYLIHTLNGHVPLPALYTIALAACFLIAYAGYVLIEKPAIAFGARTAARLAARRSNAYVLDRPS